MVNIPSAMVLHNHIGGADTILTSTIGEKDLGKCLGVDIKRTY